MLNVDINPLPPCLSRDGRQVLVENHLRDKSGEFDPEDLGKECRLLHCTPRIIHSGYINRYWAGGLLRDARESLRRPPAWLHPNTGKTITQKHRYYTIYCMHPHKCAMRLYY
jgi:hypothetical protein